jgi:hypothetical protein
MRRIAIAWVLLGACNQQSKDASKQTGSSAPAKAAPATPAPAPAPAPTPPPAPTAADGIRLTDTPSGGAIVADTLSGYQIEFPTKPEVKDKELDLGGGHRTMITIISSDEGSAVVLNVIRLQHSDYDATDLDGLYEPGFDELASEGYAKTEDVKVTLAGHPGRRFSGGPKSVAGRKMIMHAYQVIEPDHDTLFQFNLLVPDGEPAPAGVDHVPDTFAKI